MFYLVTLLSKSSSTRVQVFAGWKTSTYKLHGAVVDKEVLDLNAPIGSEFENPFALRRQAHVAAPGVDVLQLVEGFWAHQDVHTVFAETSGETNESSNV